MQQAVTAAVGASEAVLPAKDTRTEDHPETAYPISGRLPDAFSLVSQLHRTRTRRGTTVPYLTHLMAVAALVGESGGSEEEMIAALLHDVLADTDAQADSARILADIRARFGDLVVETIQLCSDHSLGDGNTPWLERKQTYLARLAKAPLPALRVACADKLHNAQSIARELKLNGPSVFERFKGDREGTLWYYRSLARLFGALVQDEPALDSGFRTMIRELRETVASLEG